MRDSWPERQREERVKRYAEALAYAIDNPQAIKDKTLQGYIETLNLLIRKLEEEEGALDGN
ncbi:MAG: hypothetical protein M1360_03435 [Candidatus Marsarchaeota archaeon]|nr:hypothetical protein [Candidatus Marsarchaeota archaeon]MCL5418966.1 hypothetical protein [Candidatus Marsarchaeota archaeon]